MPTIFDRLRARSQAKAQHRPSYNGSPQPVQNTMTTKDMVALWQKTPSKEMEQKLLTALRPTIQSALHTFVPGRESRFNIKAAKLTLDALHTYDPSRGADVSTHVFSALRRLQRYALKSDNLIKIPEETIYLRGKIQKAINEFTDDIGREPTISELSDKLSLTPSKLEKIMTGDTVTISGSQGLSEDGVDLYGKSDIGQADYLDYVYRSSDPINQKIIEWTTGRNGVRPLANNDIAKKLRISPAAVSQRKATIQQQVNEVSSLLR